MPESPGRTWWVDVVGLMSWRDEGILLTESSGWIQPKSALRLQEKAGLSLFESNWLFPELLRECPVLGSHRARIWE